MSSAAERRRSRASDDRNGRRQSFNRRSSGSFEDIVGAREGGGGGGGPASRRSRADFVPAEEQEEPEERAKRQAKAAATKNERRSFAMQRFSMDNGMNDALADVSNELVHGIQADATAKKKMEAVMINAKQKGMTVPQIFKLFLGRENDDDPKLTDEDLDIELSPADFGAALKRLGGRLFSVTSAELKELVDDFDEDKNGTISIIEFRNWCYHIPHLSWKAERLRFEKGDDGSGGGGASSMSTHKSTRRMTHTVDEPSAEKKGKQAAPLAVPAKLTEVYKGTKLFWHTREKIEIVLTESKPYGTVVLSTLNETTKQVAPVIFIDLSVASSLIDANAMKTSIDKAIERAEKESKGPGGGSGQTRKIDLGEKAEIGDRVRREMLANIVLLRLKVIDGGARVLPLESDDAPVRERLVLADNPGVPPLELPQFEVRENVDFKAHASALKDMEELQAGMSKLTAASDRASTQLRRSLDAIERLKEMSSGNQIEGSSAKKRLYWAMRRSAVKAKVQKVRARLSRSPTYHALLEFQAEKGNTESRALLLELRASNSLPAL